MVRTSHWLLLPVALGLLGFKPSCRNTESQRERVSEAAAQADSSGEAEPAPPPDPSKIVWLDPEQPLNVMLILIDGLRADTVPWHGYERDNAPRLTELAERSVVYTEAYSISSSTSRSVGPLLIGRYPSESVRSGYYFTNWFPENEFIGERLQEFGHHTLSAHSHAYFTKETGIAQGFADFRKLPGTRMMNLDKDNITSERMVTLAKEMLSVPAITQQNDKRFFAYFHFMDPHAPYLPHAGRPRFGATPRDFYDQEIHYTDEWVGNLIDWCLEQPWGEHTAFIVSSDHGESFGEHNLYKHGYELWQEVVRVPMLVYAPKAHARRIDTPRGHIDLAPTIYELMGVEPPEALSGVSLVPELYGLEPESRTVVVDLPRDNLQDRRRAIIEGRYKLIAFNDDKLFRLFDLQSDPKEQRDLAESEPELLERLKQRYEALSAGIGLEEIRGYSPLKGAPDGRRW